MRDLTKVYEVGETEIRALAGIDLEIPCGEFVSIMGPSGSGKSTLLNIMGCIDTPTSGSLEIMDDEVSQLGDRELTAIRLSTIGFIFQQFYLIPTLNAIENVELPMREARIPKEERHARAMELLDMVGLSRRLNHLPNQLSGGEQQRVAIARALANEPRILLADEPTGEVDSKTSDHILSIMEQLNRERGLTMVVVSHDPTVANRAPRRLTMMDGLIEGDRSGPVVTGAPRQVG
ncbi:MAG: ABC transporter ATP-binding protein [Thermoplasmata archaeon]|nr:MAG: ABC transporter ATP-binding protein [Thermoplasmata archaeon]